MLVELFNSCRLTKLLVSCCSRVVNGASSDLASMPPTVDPDGGCGKPSVHLLSTCCWYSTISIVCKDSNYLRNLIRYLM